MASSLIEDEGGDDGTVRVWIAFASEPRLILALVVGPRTQPSADALIGRTASVLVGRLPLLVSDGLTQYGTALLERWHVEVPVSQGRAHTLGHGQHPSRQRTFTLKVMEKLAAGVPP